MDLVGKMRALKKEGNWNLVVLYAVEWTRKQPANADAWKELSHGLYQVAPVRRGAGALRQKRCSSRPTISCNGKTLDRSTSPYAPRAVEALKAFHRAAVLNDHDVSQPRASRAIERASLDVFLKRGPPSPKR